MPCLEPSTGHSLNPRPGCRCRHAIVGICSQCHRCGLIIMFFTIIALGVWADWTTGGYPCEINAELAATTLWLQYNGAYGDRAISMLWLCGEVNAHAMNICEGTRQGPLSRRIASFDPSLPSRPSILSSIYCVPSRLIASRHVSSRSLIHHSIPLASLLRGVTCAGLALEGQLCEGSRPAGKLGEVLPAPERLDKFSGAGQTRCVLSAPDRLSELSPRGTNSASFFARRKTWRVCVRAGKTRRVFARAGTIRLVGSGADQNTKQGDKKPGNSWTFFLRRAGNEKTM